MSGRKLYIPTSKLGLLFPMQSARRKQRKDVCTPFDAWVAACIYTFRSPFLTPEAIFHTLGYDFKKHRQRHVKQIADSLRILKSKGVIDRATLEKTGQFRIIAHFPKPKQEFFTALDVGVAKLPALVQIIYLSIKAVKVPVLHWEQIARHICPRPYAPRRATLDAFKLLVKNDFLNGHIEGGYIILEKTNKKGGKIVSS